MIAWTDVDLSDFNFRLRYSLLLLTASILASASSQADVVDWSVGRFQYSQQTADNTAPGAPDDFEVFGQLATDDSSDFTSAVLNGPGGISIPFTDPSGGGDWEFFESFGTEADMLAAFPDGTYTIDATGPLGTFSESVDFGSAFATAPVFTGSVFSDLQGMDPTQDFELTWTAPPSDGWLLFGEEVGGSTVFFQDGIRNAFSSDTGFTILGGTLEANTQYEVEVTFVDLVDDARDSFLQGFGFAPATGSSTSISFTTGSAAAVPEPATVPGIALLVAGAWMTRRKRAQTA